MMISTRTMYCSGYSQHTVFTILQVRPFFKHDTCVKKKVGRLANRFWVLWTILNRKSRMDFLLFRLFLANSRLFVLFKIK